MKVSFYVGLLCLLLFEIANVYFIMPMPGSQEMETISVAYTLYTWRWFFRFIFSILIVLGIRTVFKRHIWLPIISILIVAIGTYFINFQMSADTMFYQPNKLSFQTTEKNIVGQYKLVLGVEINGQAKVYPIQYLGYHHIVYDTIGSKPVIVTYCTVCRTGRVFEPVINGRLQEFRLVGMDHFNAMFEDKTTGTWWRQATGEAVIGELKGMRLPEVKFLQTTLAQWLHFHPKSLIMQPDSAFLQSYEHMKNYERGKSKSHLTLRDTASWQKKSWIVGVQIDQDAKAYDWNRLVKERFIQDVVGGKPILVALSKDSFSFVVLERRDVNQRFQLVNDTFISSGERYNFFGKSLSHTNDLSTIRAYQEYWHSWKNFHPSTRH